MPAETIVQKANRNKRLLRASVFLTGFIVLLGFIIALMARNNYLQKEQNLPAERNQSHLVPQKTLSMDTREVVSIIEPVHADDLVATAPEKPMPDVIAEIPAIMLNNEPTAQEKQQALSAALTEYNSQMQNVAVVDKVIVVPDVTDATDQNKTKNNHAQKFKFIPRGKPREITLNKQSYTIQLLGSHSEQAIRNFINIHKISSQVSYFKTRLNGKNWYVLVYGHYSSKDKASTAIAKLPNTLRQLQPWPRRFVDIKQS